MQKSMVGGSKWLVRGRIFTVLCTAQKPVATVADERSFQRPAIHRTTRAVSAVKWSGARTGADEVDRIHHETS